MALFRSDPWPSKRHVEVLGAKVSYIAAGSGRPVVFLHGNPTSSVLWRSVIPHVAKKARCIAPDLIGMGDSSKVGTGATSYRFLDHRTYLDAMLEVLGIKRDVVLVGHERGGALLFDWAQRNRASIAGIAYMETIVTPLNWSDMPSDAIRVYQALRSPSGEMVALAKNIVVERLLQIGVRTPLSDDVMNEYRRPFTMVGEDRRPTLTLARELPIEGEPRAVVDVVRRYERWLEASPVPKLFIDAEPGFLLRGRPRDVCLAWPNQRRVRVPGHHYVQEDSGPQIGKAIAQWLDEL
jgi:haloalkane dehalogenase